MSLLRKTILCSLSIVRGREGRKGRKEGEKNIQEKKDIMGIYKEGRIKYERMKSSGNVHFITPTLSRIEILLEQNPTDDVNENS